MLEVSKRQISLVSFVLYLIIILTHTPSLFSVFYHASAPIESQPDLLSLSNYDPKGGFDGPGRFLNRPPTNFGALANDASEKFLARFPPSAGAGAEAASEVETTAPRGTCFVHKSGDAFSGRLLSRLNQSGQTPLETATSKLMGTGGLGIHAGDAIIDSPSDAVEEVAGNEGLSRLMGKHPG